MLKMASRVMPSIEDLRHACHDFGGQNFENTLRMTRKTMTNLLTTQLTEISKSLSSDKDYKNTNFF